MQKNVALIFAGGSGKRMNTKSRPKQFLELHGKPIIIYTLELFENHPEIDGIIVACIESWIPYLQKLLKKFELSKVVSIVPGGETGQDSICHALVEADRLYPKDTLVLIHDGVRPLITEETISDNIRVAAEQGSCITCVKATETLVVLQPDGSLQIPSRANSLIARAPQTFVLQNILKAHHQALEEKKHDFIDSCTLMSYYGYHMATVLGPSENIKITTPTDFYVFRAIEDVRENSQIFGI